MKYNYMWRIWRIYLYIDNLGKSFRGYNNFGETTLGILENVDFFQASQTAWPIFFSLKSIVKLTQFASFPSG